MVQDHGGKVRRRHEFWPGNEDLFDRLGKLQAMSPSEEIAHNLGGDTICNDVLHILAQKRQCFMQKRNKSFEDRIARENRTPSLADLGSVRVDYSA